MRVVKLLTYDTEDELAGSVQIARGLHDQDDENEWQYTVNLMLKQLRRAVASEKP
jgi:hypothetical protein